MSASVYSTILLREFIYDCPHKLGDIKEIENVQKRATKLVINLKKIPYTNRLQRLKPVSYTHLTLPTILRV